MQYDCLNVAAWDHEGVRNVATVNRCEETVSATLSGFGSGPEVEVPFESRTLPLDSGEFEDTFEPLGVHLYKVDAS